MPPRLTTTQKQVLDALRRRIDNGEPAPTYRDLCAEFGWSSTGTARDHLKALARKGYIGLSAGSGHRGVHLIEERAPLTRVPLSGRVKAGVPVLSEENVEGHILVPAEWIRAGTYFALTVAGDSMKDAGVLEGDRVVVRNQNTANDGDIVVATIDGESTLKRFRLRGSRVTLIAENSRYRPIDVRTESAVIHGVVVGLMRGYAIHTGATQRRSRRYT